MAALLRQSLTLPRLRAAYARVHDNNGQPGVDGIDVETYGQRLEADLPVLRLEVLGGRYRPLPLKRLWLPRPGKAPRPLAVPTVRDRVLLTAVALTLTPLLEAEFEECSYAYRQGRSVRMAVERIGLLQRQGYQWVVEADIEKFFDRIPHDKLLAELHAITRDDELIELVRVLLAAPVSEGDQLLPTILGIPQGSPLSPLLANLYLDHLDEAILDHGYALVRYADDFIILAKSRVRAEAAVELSAQVLRDLELRLNPLKTRVVNFETGFQFLGWNFVRSLAVPASRAVTEHNYTKVAVQSSATTIGPAPVWPANSEVADAFSEALSERPDWHPSEQSVEGTAAPELAPKVIAIPDEEMVERELTVAAAEDAFPPEDTPLDEDAPASLPPPSLQRTLYLVDPAVSLATENHHLLVRRGEETVLDLPAVNVDQVMIFGRNPVTTAALICCMRHDIPVSYLSRIGKFYGRTEPPTGETVLLLAAQFAAHASGELDLALAREIVHGKLANSALLLSRYARNRQGDDARRIRDAVDLLRNLARRTRGAPDLDVLRGLEGAGAAAYFGVWRIWLAPRWTFGNREPRGGADPINALLDLGYSLLRQSIAGLVQARGLNPWLGHLHRLKSGHMALASDLMEEFRPMVVDAEVLNTCLNGGLVPQDFVSREGVCTLRPEAARGYIRALETRFNSERQHPHSQELLDLRRIMDAQVRSLCTAYRQSDPAAYRACIFR